jgi:pyridoxine 5-phosphate synthase
MTKLSVNINKIATIRNARGGNMPDLLRFAKDCERFGADGITVHPRPDERHITTNDVYDLSTVLESEFNIEGNPDERFMKMMRDLNPTQATLVPDSAEQLTSDSGWDTIKNASFLKETITEIKGLGIRCSLFIDPNVQMIESAAKLGADRVELYTGPFAEKFPKNRKEAIKEYKLAAEVARKCGLTLNAGHDLSLENLSFFKNEIVGLEEVSIGHALISDALYLGIENTIQQYKRQLL